LKDVTATPFLRVGFLDDRIVISRTGVFRLLNIATLGFLRTGSAVHLGDIFGQDSPVEVLDRDLNRIRLFKGVACGPNPYITLFTHSGRAYVLDLPIFIVKRPNSYRVLVAEFSERHPGLIEFHFLRHIEWINYGLPIAWLGLVVLASFKFGWGILMFFFFPVLIYMIPWIVFRIICLLFSWLRLEKLPEPMFHNLKLFYGLSAAVVALSGISLVQILKGPGLLSFSFIPAVAALVLGLYGIAIGCVGRNEAALRR